MSRRSIPTAPKQGASRLDALTAAERGEVLDALLAARPELGDEAERIAGELLSVVSTEQIATAVGAALTWISLDALAARAGHVRGRSYVHESEAAWELVEETIEPFRSDLNRRATLGLSEAATNLAIGIVAGLHQVRDAEMGTVLAYAGEDATEELAAAILNQAASLGLTVPDDAPKSHWPRWFDLW